QMPCDGGEHADIIGALVEMGFDRKSSASQVSNIALELEKQSGGNTSSTKAEREQEIFRRAIVQLSS
ncbi:MAG: hypothetical protein JW875_07620, partial [Spirochaetales bacterium]|nr:hypothetical protein [Spirochaetales bacterium]